MWKCTKCPYFTNREFNLNLHINAKHNDNREIFTCDQCHKTFVTNRGLQGHIKKFHNDSNECPNLADLCPKLAKVCPNLADLCPKLAKVCPNLAEVCPNLATTPGVISCDSCQKVFAHKTSLYKHVREKRCTGTNNPLVCSKCMQTFDTINVKYKHGKICTGPPPSQPTIIHNTTNNTTNNTYNITMVCNQVVYNDRGIEFMDDHITPKAMRKMVVEAGNETVPFLMEYIKALFDKPENQVVRKDHLSSSVSLVHVGNGMWNARPDCSVMPRICQDVATSANDKLYVHPNIGHSQLRREINELASYDDEIAKNKKLRRETKVFLYNMTKQKPKTTKQNDDIEPGTAEM